MVGERASDIGFLLVLENLHWAIQVRDSCQARVQGEQGASQGLRQCDIQWADLRTRSSARYSGPLASPESLAQVGAPCCVWHALGLPMPSSAPRRPVAALLVVTLLVSAAGLISLVRGAEPELRFGRTTFTDPMAGGVEAVSVLVPEGWVATGGIEWLPAWSRGAHIRTYVSDPQSGVAIAWLPIQDFIHFRPPDGMDVPIGGNYQGKAFVPPIRDPDEFVRAFWMSNPLGHLAEATLVGQRPLPQVADGFLAAFGGPGEAGAWSLRYAYEVDGQPWEQDVVFALLWSELGDITSWYVNLAYTVSGPAGSLDEQHGTIATIVASRTTTPAWEATYRLVQRLFTQGIQQQMADTVRFGELLAQYREESTRLQAEVTAERWASQDRIAQERRDVLGGVDNYVDPRSGEIVQLPVGWESYWVNAQGEYLAVDAGTADASQLRSQGWLELTPRD